jgi:hypothetical protein
MSVARSVADVLRDHVVLELEAIDRMYLNVYVPHLQTVRAVVGYLRVHKGQRFASTTAVVPMSEAFGIARMAGRATIDRRAAIGVGYPYCLAISRAGVQRNGR